VQPSFALLVMVVFWQVTKVSAPWNSSPGPPPGQSISFSYRPPPSGRAPFTFSLAGFFVLPFPVFVNDFEAYGAGGSEVSRDVFPSSRSVKVQTRAELSLLCLFAQDKFSQEWRARGGPLDSSDLERLSQVHGPPPSPVLSFFCFIPLLPFQNKGGSEEGDEFLSQESSQSSL